ncbi:MAG: Small-conductance mechanosensitive channel MscMJ [Methanothrix sp.]|jgi:small-conductance mechanosensitive channel|nr:MAG: Small-conductance mechanosensitive channel MscMJ [Methanothrix sp.]
MEEDEISLAEEDIFRQYTFPSDFGPEVSAADLDGSNLTTDLPAQLSSEIPPQLSGDGFQSSMVTFVDHLNATLGIDIVSLVTTIVTIIVILILTHLAAKIVERAFAFQIPGVRAGGKAGIDFETEMTFRTIIRRLLVAFIYIFGFVIVIFQIPPLSKIAVTFLAGAGVAGIAIGFAAKDSLANVISGIFLAVFHPFRVGDHINFENEYCQVEDLTLRHTTIRTWDGRRIFVPNSIMGNQPIVNWSIIDPIITWRVDVGIGYDADIDKAREIMLDVAKRHPLVLKDRDITVRVTDLADFAVDLRLTFDVPKRDVAFTTGCDIREAVKKRFDREGIEIPYPYRNIVIQNPEPAPIPEDRCPQGEKSGFTAS